MFRTPQGTWILDDEEMNRIMILATEATHRYNEQGCTTLANEAGNIASVIFEKLFDAERNRRAK